ncbi:DUF6447 family protein [Roseovarius dicentrarchi]|uniref:DUF6447 family protein n=1 Tax=Roseovarius dicentrarchi TaxID=2250573 RepID=UPI000DEB863C|nr:DUF6447 family protein [Roseovarius dicentrarchi]
MTDKTTITVDGKSYNLDSLSDEAKNQLGNLNVVDRKILDLQQEIGIMQTARNAYARALAAALPKN